MASKRKSIKLTFTQTCTIFPDSADDTEGIHGSLNWNFESYNGKRAALEIPLEPLFTALGQTDMPKESLELMTELIRRAVGEGIYCTKQYNDPAVVTKIIETLPWVDYSEMFRKMDDEVRAAREAKGRADRELEIAVKLFARQEQDADLLVFGESLKQDLGMSEETVKAAYELAQKARPEEFTIIIKQTREGRVKIDAASAEEAVEIADRLYNGEGAELPEMDDTGSLQFNPLIPFTDMFIFGTE